MKLSALMIVAAVVSAAFGLGFVFVPGKVLTIYGAEVTTHSAYLGQLFGGTLLGFAVLTWAARNLPHSEARQAILAALFLGDLVGGVVALIGQLTGVLNALGWLNVAIYAVFTVGFGYFRFVATAPPETTG